MCLLVSGFVSIPDQPHQLNLEGLEYNPEEHEYGLFPAPLHVGEFRFVLSVSAVSGSYRTPNHCFCRNSVRLREECLSDKNKMIGKQLNAFFCHIYYMCRTLICSCMCVSVTGKYLRVKRINFQLPYDIHWQYARNKVLLISV